MTKLYIANCTKQILEFQYRVPGHAKLYEQRIYPNTQEALPHDLPEFELMTIVGQHEHYGLVPEKQVDNVRSFVGMCYSIGREIDMRRVSRAIENNDKVLTERAHDALTESLLAADASVREKTGDQGNVSTLEVIETVPENEDRSGMDKKFKIGGRN